MNIIKKIIFTLFLLLSFIYLFIIVSPKIFKNFYPFGIKTAIILTGSMEPTINPQDFVILKSPNNIKINDIVSYKSNKNKKEILHRVIKIDGNKVITKGDANNKEDEEINISQITGIYIGKINCLGKLISFFREPFGFTLTITIFMIILLFPKKS